MIKQRCSQCRRFLAYELEVCACGASLPRFKRDAWGVIKRKGQRHFKRFGPVSKVEAEAFHAKWLAELLQPSSSSPLAETIRLDTACRIYVDKLRDAGKPYHREARLFLERLQRVVDPESILSEIAVEEARAFQRRIVKGGASLAYADRHVAVAKAMFSYAAPHLPNPFKLVKLFRPDNTIVRFLTDEQEQALLDCSASLRTKNMPWLKEVILMELRTGLRRNDILSLKWEQISFEARSCQVVQKGKRKLSVPIAMDCLEMLKKLSASSQSEYVFPNPITGKPFQHFDKSWRALKKAAGIPPGFRFHDLRHHVATKLARNTRNPLLVQMILGHSEIRTTQKYMHAWNSDLLAAVDGLNDAKK